MIEILASSRKIRLGIVRLFKKDAPQQWREGIFFHTADHESKILSAVRAEKAMPQPRQNRHSKRPSLIVQTAS